MLSSCIKSSSKRFPPFITGSAIFHYDMEIDKVFPKIGLSNFKEPIDIKFDCSTIQLDKVIHLAIKKWLEKWHDDRLSLAHIRNPLELLKMSKVLYVLEELNRRFNKKDGVGIVNDKVVLTTAIPSYDGKALIKTGADCFQLVKTLLHYGSKYVQINIVSTNEIQTQCKNLHLVFRSDTIDGAWDITTMSMRGIKSCMRWEAKQSPALVGSIVDPCCGIMYITNDTKTDFGSKMLFRSVVRLAVHKTGKPVILVDRVYSAFYQTKPQEIGTFDKQIKNLFITELQKKIPNYTVVDAQTANLDSCGYIIPRFNNFEKLSEIEVSYRDTHIPYGNSTNHISEYLPQLLKETRKIKQKSSKRVYKSKKTK